MAAALAARPGTETSKARLLWRAPPGTTGSADMERCAVNESVMKRAPM